MKKTGKERAAAIAAGMKRYFTGKPCKNGHIAERLVLDHGCVQCKLSHATSWKQRNADQQREYRRTVGIENQRRWYAANRDQANAASLQWYEANAEHASARSRAWHAANPEKDAATKQRFLTNNPGIANAYAAKRRAALLKQTPPWADHDAIEAMYALAAIYRDFGHDVHVDHEVPLRGRKVSGLHVHHNLQVIPAAVNQSKSNRFHI